MFLRNLVALCVIGMAFAYETPVFLWGVNRIGAPALKQISQNKFAGVIAPLLKDNMVVVFEEEGLTARDFVCTNEETSCYAYLRGVPQKTYFSSVENPIEALRSLTTEREFQTINSNGELESPLECAAGKVVFVTFDDIEKTRSTKIEAHDAVIESITNKLNCPTAYMYLATPSPTSVKRSKRDTAATEGGYIFQTSTFLLFFTKLYVTSSGTTKEIIVNNMTLSNQNSTQFTVTLTTSDGSSLNFYIALSGGYYSMGNVNYESVTYRAVDVNAPTTFSYHCGNLTLYSTTDTSKYLLWNSLQMQAPFSGSDQTFIFSDSWDCVAFFTPGILMGLFVVILILAITFTGICWMVDINTMDRFDDPKGKTITINVSE